MIPGEDQQHYWSKIRQLSKDITVTQRRRGSPWKWDPWASVEGTRWGRGGRALGCLLGLGHTGLTGTDMILSQTLECGDLVSRRGREPPHLSLSCWSRVFWVKNDGS